MSTREQRIKVFEDTMRWIKSDPVLMESIDEGKIYTELYFDNDYPVFDETAIKETQICVTKSRSFEAAMSLQKENFEARIGVLNFANAFKPGGGVEKGSSAQEESLCRCSTLYPLLNRKTLRNNFYQYHKYLNTSKASDSIIYTPEVLILKSDEDLPKRLHHRDWREVDVFTMAAPDLRKKHNRHAPLTNNGTSMSDAELFGIHVKRAMHLFTVAASKEVDILVLGAFGCGAFENNPEVVAKAYKTALENFPKVFTKVEFAIYCSPADSKNYDTFKRIFC